MSVWLYGGLVLLVLLCLLRAVLIVAGLYKDPVLHSFETYASDGLYSPLLTLLLWLSLTLLVFLAAFMEAASFILLLAAGSVPVIWVYQRLEDYVGRYRSLLTRYPGWYHHLLRTTSREEQRRLAYLWLRLPLRTRMLYNTHDALFHRWIDLVLLSIV
ncbi:MAG: hypothetical protein MUE40_09725 [Anaerolineae bacterium]|nr:hypothetical protein [Anaerolineae bacterium]